MDEKENPKPRPDEKLVGVWSGSNPAVTTVVQSLLKDAGIEYLIKGADFEDVFGSMVTGPVSFLVRIEDEGEARALLAKTENDSDDDTKP